MLLATVSPLAKRLATPALGSVRTFVNKATILGHVGQDAEVTKLTSDPNKTVVHFNVATTEYRKDAEGKFHPLTNWHRIVSWDQEKNLHLANRVKKGYMVYVQGSIRYRTYIAKDGTEKNLTEIVLQNFQSFAPKEPKQE
ncbi:MAG: hypothetical protein J3Q66DRAFT_435166 [Benniella sp.]|nr:MAG: hypothetical protein J3Q66DRAFT_435166 [Benniella sp.]